MRKLLDSGNRFSVGGRDPLAWQHEVLVILLTVEGGIDAKAFSPLWLVLAAAPLLGGCEQGPLMPDRCNIRLALVSPDPATLMVGQEATLQAQLTASPERLPADAQASSLRWASEDTRICNDAQPPCDEPNPGGRTLGMRPAAEPTASLGGEQL